MILIITKGDVSAKLSVILHDGISEQGMHTWSMLDKVDYMNLQQGQVAVSGRCRL
jgi:hypothetical protein